LTSATVSIGTIQLPIWILLAGGGVALYFVMKK